MKRAAPFVLLLLVTLAPAAPAPDEYLVDGHAASAHVAAVGGAAAQANVANTLAAPQDNDADFHTKGPNSAWDVRQFGGYIGTNYDTPTTGTIRSGSTTLRGGVGAGFREWAGRVGAGSGPGTMDCDTTNALGDADSANGKHRAELLRGGYGLVQRTNTLQRGGHDGRRVFGVWVAVVRDFGVVHDEWSGDDHNERGTQYTDNAI
jgi:hypothetical protein